MQSNTIRTCVKEIFTSIQGEGPYVGYKQLFIRFCKCNLTCNFCDTDFLADEKTKNYTPEELLSTIKQLNLTNIHSISLTGGEPLLETAFLNKFLLLVNQKIYLETNGTLPEKLLEIIDLVDIISMDIKLQSATSGPDFFEKHKRFIKIAEANDKEIFAKAVFDETISDEEIDKIVNIVKDYNIELILQPLMVGNTMKMAPQKLVEIFDKFVEKYPKTRIIPQSHKFINVE